MTVANFTNYTQERDMAHLDVKVLKLEGWQKFFRSSQRLSATWAFKGSDIVKALKDIAQAWLLILLLLLLTCPLIR